MDSNASGFELHIRRARECHFKVIDAQVRLLERDPRLDPADARLSVFAKLKNTLRATEISLDVLHHDLVEGAWWRRRYSQRPQREVSSCIVAYSQFAKGGLLQFGFSALDSGSRLFLRALDPAACKGATTSFTSVIECLCLTHLGIERESLDFLRLLTPLRNTIHNEGVYFDSAEAPRSATFRGETYSFAHGEPVEFATWALVLDLTEETIALAERMAFAEALTKCGTIIDPGAEPPEDQQSAGA